MSIASFYRPLNMFGVCLFVIFSSALSSSIQAAPPRIVNIYNFIRNSDFRVQKSEDVLFDATEKEIQLVKQHNLHGTWALQYDALMNPRYQKLLKEQLGPDDEISAWWEIPKGLAEKAGLTWRGAHEWDSTANIGFSPGYTPEDRRKIVDVYMADFKDIYGHYPLTVGSWYIDEVTLAYMSEKYGVVASCNCKDQVGTDGYTLWGGYWNQAYYPSKLNAYMPAQEKSAQLDIPVFRMLGSDPIYQFANANAIYSLEPVYAWAGGSAEWVDWFTDVVRNQPCMAFGYAQMGQENSFGWHDIKKGLTLQMEKIAHQSEAGEIRVETLAASGKWFRSNFPVTPATAVVALDDWRHENRKSVWFDNRFYRMNLFWDKDGMSIRDLHRFDEKVVSSTHETALKTRSLAYGTLPIMEGGLWATKRQKAGMFPVSIAVDNTTSPLQPDGTPVVKQLSATDLSITQPLQKGGRLTILCGEKEVTFSAVDGQGQPVKWAMDSIGNSRQKSAVQSVSENSVSYTSSGISYELKLRPDSGTCKQQEDGSIRFLPNSSGVLVMQVGGY